jgi:hypothetical protein
MSLIRRTMGLHVVILAGNDRGDDRQPGTTMSVFI